MKNALLCIFCLGLWINVDAQFAGPVGTLATTAIKADSNIFVSWAKSCQLQRGWMDITDKSKGKASVGFDYNAKGKSEGFIVSLGDSGIATLTFEKPIYNGPSWDFAVFENSFSNNFLELAFVEVSSDGQRYVRFPATSNYPDSVQIGPFDEVSKAELINNLAGKYKGGYGTPFDLEELKDSAGIDISRITHVRIIDCVGSIAKPYASYDINGNAINDPFPTPFTSSGFDLDAVGVIHTTANTKRLSKKIHVWPNPVSSIIFFPEEVESLEVYSYSGQLISKLQYASDILNIQDFKEGFYTFKALKNGHLLNGTFTVSR